MADMLKTLCKGSTLSREKFILELGHLVMKAAALYNAHLAHEEVPRTFLISVSVATGS